jgi:hypothetical protein
LLWTLTNIASSTKTKFADAISAAQLAECAVAVMKSPNHEVAFVFFSSSPFSASPITPMTGSDLTSMWIYSGQACWFIANLSGNGAEYRDRCLNANALPEVIRILEDPNTEPKIRETASWGLFNLCRFKPWPAYTQVRSEMGNLKKKLHGTFTDD